MIIQVKENIEVRNREYLWTFKIVRLLKSEMNISGGLKKRSHFDHLFKHAVFDKLLLFLELWESQINSLFIDTLLFLVGELVFKQS